MNVDGRENGFVFYVMIITSTFFFFSFFKDKNVIRNKLQVNQETLVICKTQNLFIFLIIFYLYFT